MIADSRFSRFANEFVSQWLSLDKFQVLEADRKRYPKLTRDTRTALKQEPVEFVKHLIRNNLPVKESDLVRFHRRERSRRRPTTVSATKPRVDSALSRFRMGGLTWEAC